MAPLTVFYHNVDIFDTIKNNEAYTEYGKSHVF